jgi:exodeoxyribonuclease VII small subunit
MSNSSFEKKLEQSKKIIDKLMDSEITLEEAIKLYKEGLEAIKEAQKMLEEAKLKVEKINKQTSGVDE